MIKNKNRFNQTRKSEVVAEKTLNPSQAHLIIFQAGKNIKITILIMSVFFYQLRIGHALSHFRDLESFSEVFLQVL